MRSSHSRRWWPMALAILSGSLLLGFGLYRYTRPTPVVPTPPTLAPGSHQVSEATIRGDLLRVVMLERCNANDLDFLDGSMDDRLGLGQTRWPSNGARQDVIGVMPMIYDMKLQNIRLALQKERSLVAALPGDQTQNALKLYIAAQQTLANLYQQEFVARQPMLQTAAKLLGLMADARLHHVEPATQPGWIDAVATLGSQKKFYQAQASPLLEDINHQWGDLSRLAGVDAFVTEPSTEHCPPRPNVVGSSEFMVAIYYRWKTFPDLER
ncbi:hypothetical protein [Dyella sp. GSA-30]|uniref:hypothetical protein n=1 Tax=Dyella sp. GSA-30 TaxID=2994496 RepID=UPI00249362BF|nr:hypothetical protein [Dyella sp. GSA-30]BDU19609.1 hypothetical protein DYGSA30_10660 [Dyella sp. GSA-30]